MKALSPQDVLLLSEKVLNAHREIQPLNLNIDVANTPFQKDTYDNNIGESLLVVQCLGTTKCSIHPKAAFIPYWYVCGRHHHGLILYSVHSSSEKTDLFKRQMFAIADCQEGHYHCLIGAFMVIYYHSKDAKSLPQYRVGEVHSLNSNIKIVVDGQIQEIYNVL